MEGWKDIQFGSLGNNYSGISGKTKDDFGKGVSYIPYVNVFNNSKININKFDLVDIRPNEKQNKVRYGDILFTTSSETIREVGMTSVILDNLDEVYLNSFCFGFRLHNFDTLLPEYARYLLRSEKLRHKISMHGKGSTRFNISKGSLFKELYIHIPESTNEQRKIAEILSTVDRVIEQTEELIAKYRNIKQGLMHDLLTYGIDSDGNIRNPKTHKFETKNGILVPAEWSIKNIKQTSYLKGRIGWQGLKASEFIEEGPFLVTGTDIINGKINWGNCYHVSMDRYVEADKIQLKEDDLIITKDGTIGKVAIVKHCPKYAVLNSGLFLLRCTDGTYLHSFLYYVLTSSIFLSFLANNEGGSTIKHLYQNIFEKFVFPTPDITEQRKIINIIEEQDRAIDFEEQNLSKYKKIKQGLMHDLLTPTKRVQL